MSDPKSRYADYLKTEYWITVSDAVKKRDGYKCRVCNSPHDIQAHHRNYAHRGDELNHLDDLTTLCRRCHETFHGQAKPTQPAPIPAPIVRAPCPTGVLVTPANCKMLRMSKETWAYMAREGINPRQSKWAARMVGRIVPAHFFRGKQPR